MKTMQISSQQQLYFNYFKQRKGKSVSTNNPTFNARYKVNNTLSDESVQKLRDIVQKFGGCVVTLMTGAIHFFLYNEDSKNFKDTLDKSELKSSVDYSPVIKGDADSNLSNEGIKFTYDATTLLYKNPMISLKTLNELITETDTHAYLEKFYDLSKYHVKCPEHICYSKDYNMTLDDFYRNKFIELNAHQRNKK